MGAAHPTVFTCARDRYASSGGAVRMRLRAGWAEVEMAVM